MGGNRANLSAANFTPNGTVTLSYYPPQSASSPTTTWTVTASCGGGFSTGVTTTGGLIRTDKVIACHVVKNCASATINILL